MFRAEVVDNQDPQKRGRVVVWIPDLMPLVERSSGIWARPANNPIGGRNTEASDEHHYMGTCYIPRKGAWVWVFFESADINRPYYFGALDLENTTVLPENQVGTNYQDKWTIFKSHDGRTIIVSDDSDDARVEITGKKRELKSPPTGDTDSVYKIDDNQTTILFDERSGDQKILIRTYKGDFFNINIEDRELHANFDGDIHINSNKNIYLTSNEDFNIKSKTGKINIQASADDINIKSGGDISESCGKSHNTKAGKDVVESSSGKISSLAGSEVSHDPKINDAGGASGAASDSGSATEASPEGSRDPS
jgi:hypothetical protein